MSHPDDPFKEFANKLSNSLKNLSSIKLTNDEIKNHLRLIESDFHLSIIADICWIIGYYLLFSVSWKVAVGLFLLDFAAGINLNIKKN